MRSLLLPISAALAAHPLGPGAGPWEMETPEAHGLDGEALETAKEHTRNKRKGRDCYVVIKDGALVYEWYSSPDYNTTNHAGHSMTKMLGALIAGYAVTHEGLDIDADITETYGVKSPKSYPVTSRQIMSQSLAGEDGPGEQWVYDAIGIKWINHLTKVVPAATGKKPSEIWQEHFAENLGFDSLTFDKADSMWADGSMGTCRDYARLGQLMLNKGSWKDVDEPIVSADYIKQLSTPQTRFAPYTEYSNPCYGLLTWLTDVGKVGEDTPYPGKACLSPSGGLFPGINPPLPTMPKGSPADMFTAAGLQGQFVMVFPSHDMVVVSMGHTNALLEDYVPVDMVEGLCVAGVLEGCGADMVV